jgi:hypothetical protein
VANVFNQAGETEDITTAEFRRQDQRRALQIAGMSALVGALIAVGAALV